MTEIIDHPSGDKRYIEVDRAMDRFHFQKDALLEVLNTAQEVFGYLSEDLIIYISSKLMVPISQVYGVATFYHLFTFAPLGENNCTICTGTACHVKGSGQILSTLAAEFGINPGETTPDGLFSLTTARCFGSCGLAPIMVLNGEVAGKETPETAVLKVQKVIAKSKEKSN